jgi:hypothetical protein
MENIKLKRKKWWEQPENREKIEQANKRRHEELNNTQIVSAKNNMSWKTTNWYKISQKQETLDNKLKNIIKTDPFFVSLFREYNIPLDRMDNELVFKVKDLKGRFSQANGKEVYLSTKLFENNDFFENNLHFVIHELIHWLTRQKEADSYFSDPEEIKSFSFGIAYELKKGKSKEEIYKVFYPIIEGNVKNKLQAQKIFSIILKRAILILKEFSNG